VQRDFRFASSATTRESYDFITGCLLMEHSVVTKGSPGCQTGGEEISASFRMLESFFHENRAIGNSILNATNWTLRFQPHLNPGIPSFRPFRIGNRLSNISIRRISQGFLKFIEPAVDFVRRRPTLLVTALDLVLGPASRVPRIVAQHSGTRTAHCFSFTPSEATRYRNSDLPIFAVFS
jgi:hypothetical protein